MLVGEVNGRARSARRRSGCARERGVRVRCAACCLSRACCMRASSSPSSRMSRKRMGGAKLRS
eukprot:6192831-Pleurochrysis_carterae.AAC.1